MVMSVCMATVGRVAAVPCGAVSMIVLGKLKYIPGCGQSMYCCRSADQKIAKITIALDDRADGLHHMTMIEDRSGNYQTHEGKLLDPVRWKAKNNCEVIHGRLDDGSEFVFKAYLVDGRFEFLVNEYINPKDLEADYIDYKQLIGKDIIGDRTYTDAYRM